MDSIPKQFRAAILDDSPAVSDLWQSWLQQHFSAEVSVITPTDDWKTLLDSILPAVLFIDVTSKAIPAENVCQYIAGSAALSRCALVLTCGYKDSLDRIITELVSLVRGQATVLRKPATEQDFLSIVSSLNRPTISSANKTTTDMIPKFSSPNEAVSTRFSWLSQDTTVSAYAIGAVGGPAQIQGGRDCGDLMQGGAYFRDLAQKIGSELGLENLKELHAVCDGCRFLSVVVPGGISANVLTQPEADLNVLAKELTTAR